MHTPYIPYVKYVEWDHAKARSNARRHRVDFADAAVALGDERALTIEDRDHTELRFKTLGMGPNMSILLVVYSMPDPETVRIISARHATRLQVRQYFEGLPRG